MRVFVAGVVGGVIWAVALLSATAVPATAATDAVSWSVEPSAADGEPTGDRWAEFELDPGESARGYMRVVNRGSEEATFSLSAADGYFTESGRFNMLPGDQASIDAGTWISLPDSVSVEAGADVVIPFVVDVPSQATPGDHLAGVAAGIFSQNDTVGVESRIGFRVLTRVAGELVASVASTATADYAPSWNPFLPGRLTVVVSTENTGNTRLTATNAVTVSGPLGFDERTSVAPSSPEMAPGDVRDATIVVDDVWPTFLTTATVSTSSTGVGDTDQSAAAEVRTTAATPPWSQLALLLAVIAVVVVGRHERRRRRSRRERELADAREEGRRAAITAAALALAVGVVVDASLLSAPPAEAATPVTVDITPRPDPSLAAPVVPDVGSLATTGHVVSDLLLIGGLGAVAVGAAVWVVSAWRARGHRSDASAPDGVPVRSRTPAQVIDDGDTW